MGEYQELMKSYEQRFKIGRVKKYKTILSMQNRNSIFNAMLAFMMGYINLILRDSNQTVDVTENTKTMVRLISDSSIVIASFCVTDYFRYFLGAPEIDEILKNNPALKLNSEEEKLINEKKKVLSLRYGRSKKQEEK